MCNWSKTSKMRVVVKQAHFPHTSVYYDRHAVQFTYGLSGIASCYCAEDLCLLSEFPLCLHPQCVQKLYLQQWYGQQSQW